MAHVIVDGNFTTIIHHVITVKTEAIWHAVNDKILPLDEMMAPPDEMMAPPDDKVLEALRDIIRALSDKDKETGGMCIM